MRRCNLVLQAREDQANISALALLVRQCGKSKALLDGKWLHALVCNFGYDRATYLGNCLVEMYGDCGRLDYAQAVFDNISMPNSYSWNIFLKAYTQNGNLDGARHLFDRIPEPDLYSWHTLIDSYGRAGHLDAAFDLFSRMTQRNIVSWTAMMKAYVQNGHGKKALKLFCQMQLELESVHPDQITFVCSLDACASLSFLEEGQWIHSAIVHNGFDYAVMVGNALINMYGKCKSLDEARNVFGQLHHRDVVSWNSVITVCAENGHSDEALNLFRRMHRDNVAPKKFTFICTLNACSNLVSLKEGQEIHITMVNWGCQHDVMIENALISMYGKCGSVCDAMNVFVRIPDRNVISWTAMIDVFADNGHVKEALDLFWQMQHDGVKPNGITFICVLTACSHTGQVEEGRRYFTSMKMDHGIVPTGDHYLCMIDLLGRAGHLDEAEILINHVPFDKSYIAWFCLLVVCKIHGDLKRGARAAAHCFQMDVKNIVPYAILSNILPEVVCG